MNKKGVEITMNTIVVAAIALLVLVVLSAIFLGRIGTFGEKSESCEVQGGLCAPTGECGNPDYGAGGFPQKNPLLSCPDDNVGNSQVCCIPVKV